MEPRARRSGGRPHPFGGLGRAQTQVVDQDDNRPVLDAETPESAVELVLGGDVGCRVRYAIACIRKKPQVAALTPFAACLGVAGTDQEPIGPGLEPIGIPAACGRCRQRLEQRLAGWRPGRGWGRAGSGAPPSADGRR